MKIEDLLKPEEREALLKKRWDEMDCDICGKTSDIVWTARGRGPQNGKQFCRPCMAEWNPDAQKIGERQ